MKENRDVLYVRLPKVVLAWINDKSVELGLSQAEFTSVLFKSLMINYSDKELNKIIFGLKPTLTKRDVVRDPSVRELKKNLKINLE